MTTIFGRIIAGEIPCTKVYEDDMVLAFDDVSPQAPVHVLIIPKQALINLNDVDKSHEALLGRLLSTVRVVAEKKGIAAGGYRVVMNNGENGGQSVYHMHLHVLGGRPLSWPPG